MQSHPPSVVRSARPAGARDLGPFNVFTSKDAPLELLALLGGQRLHDLLTPSYELRAFRRFDFLTRFHANSPRQILRRPETIFRVSRTADYHLKQAGVASRMALAESGPEKAAAFHVLALEHFAKAKLEELSARPNTHLKEED